ncbi:HAD family hydrolase [Photobacterium makurazakiensis]|uniref:HAD family hydrolase n=1 Tax=Photobacterium makurazakiensis TaxID=2910234 RepID=UPI003D131EB8
MNTLKSVIMFDLDGTLFDTERAIVEAFNAAFSSLNYPHLPNPTDIKATIGMPLEVAFSTLAGQPKNSSAVTELCQEYQQQFKITLLPKAESLLFPGVISGLTMLKQQNYSLSVTTNKFANSANALLEAAGIAKFFDIVVCADEVTAKKPAPESGEKILNYYGATPADALMVGDTTHDILMANNLGSDAIAVNYGIHSEHELRTASPKWIVSNFDDVVKTAIKHFGFKL